MVNDDNWCLSENWTLQNPFEDDHAFPIKIAISWGQDIPSPISLPWSPWKKLHSTMTRALFHLVHEMWRSSHLGKPVDLWKPVDLGTMDLGKPVDLGGLRIHVIAMSCVIWRWGAQALAARLVINKKF